MDEAKRDNKGKLEWHQFPMWLFEPVIEDAMIGGEKYDRWNYLKGAPITQYTDCIKRHLTAFESPYESDIDKEGFHHLAAVAWNALVAIHVMKRKPEFDDRYKEEQQDKCTKCLDTGLLVNVNGIKFCDCENGKKEMIKYDTKS